MTLADTLKLTPAEQEQERLRAAIKAGEAVTVEGWVPESRRTEFEATLERVSKLAAKLGLPAWIVEPLGERERSMGQLVCAVTGRTRDRLVVQVGYRVTGSWPRLPGGWQLVAVIDHRMAEPIVSCVPGQELPAGQRERGPVCDHCGTRRHRAETCVLRAEDGRVVQVGKQCLRDFLGVSGLDPMAVLSLLAHLRDALSAADSYWDDEGGGGAGSPSMLDVQHVVTLSACAVDEFGWCSKGREQASYGKEMATARIVELCLFPPRTRSSATEGTWAIIDAVKARYGDHVEAEAKLAIAWAAALDARSEYELNLRAVAKSTYVTHKHLGLLVSLVAAYRREQERLVQRERRAVRTAGSQFVGEVKQRIEIQVELLEPTRAFDSDFGTSYLHKFIDAQGNLFVWFGSRDLHDSGKGWPVGETRTIKGTIKKHEEKYGAKQTALTRVQEVKK